METFSALLAICAGNSPVTDEFPAQRPATLSFDVFFDLRLTKWLSKQWWRWWFETPTRSLWRHCNGNQVVRYNTSQQNKELISVLNLKLLQIKLGSHCVCTVLHRMVTPPNSYHNSANHSSANHDDVIKWKHFPRYWPFVRFPVNSPHKGPLRGALMFSLICVWINGWVNNGDAGDLRRYRAHYDVTVMTDNFPRAIFNLPSTCVGHHHGQILTILANFPSIQTMRIAMRATQSCHRLSFFLALTNDLCGDLAYWFLPDASFGIRVSVQIITACVIWTNVGILLFEPLKQSSMKFKMDIIHFHSTKCIWKCRMRNCVHFVSVSL